MIRSLKQKLNFIEMIEATKTKLQFWRWRNLIIIGRIEVVKKTFFDSEVNVSRRSNFHQ